MLQIKKFLEKVSYMDSRASRDLILPAQDARMLRDEIVSLLINRVDQEKNKKPLDEINISGGRW